MLAWLLAACSPKTAPVAPPAAPPLDDAACFAEVARTLSADDMDGRGTGTPGIEKARAYLETRLTALGLTAVGRDQRIPVVTGVALGTDNALSGPKGPLTVGKDWTPLGFSSDGAFEGEVVFAGYGIRAEEKGYDDLTGLDVKGKVVLAFRYEPGESDADSPFDGKRPTRWSDLRYKALRMREAGASALVLVTGPLNAEETEQDGLPRLKPEGPTSVAGLPVLQVTRAVAAAWAKQGGADLEALQKAIDGDYRPHGRALKGVRVSGRVDLAPTQVDAHNVLYTLPGSGALADEVVVLGAHYDHLGHGGRGAMNPDVDAIHNGADDNASGVAGVVCAAERLVDDPPAERRTILFALFTAEEIGLGGSGWYVEHPVLPLADTVAMVNLDMVGRVREGKLQAMGTDSSPGWVPFLDPLAKAEGLVLTTGGDGYGPSDQMSFYTHGVPVVHLFSGAHAEYHSPADDFATLDPVAGGKVTRLTAAAARDLATQPRMAFVQAASGPPMAGDSRGYGAYLGTIPDYTTMMESKGGVLLSGVRDGSPAAEAGLRKGDRLVALGSYTVENLYDMTFALRDHEPGETVVVKVVRDGAPVELRATLKSREERPGDARANPHAPAWSPKAGKDAAALVDPREKHLADLRQLTFGGDNAEAYWSPDGRKLVYQWTPPEGGCDQQYVLDLDSGERTMISSGRGRTTCGYYAWPKGERWVYATTENASPACPPPPDMSQGYTWAIYDGFDLVWQEPGRAPTPFLPSPGYDAEATACFRDGTIVFTSVRDGDLELYTVKPDGTGLTRLTTTKGYDGGAFFTNDCRRIVWRASRPEGDGLLDYERLLSQGLVRPSKMELFVMDRDGANVKQLTSNGAANFGPYPLPDDSGAIFASNVGASPREFDLWMVPFEGREPTQITFTPSFDGFPMFSPDGQWLVFASNRGGDGRETNLFVARWVP
jgi:Tol biopolymer transport system component